MEPNFWHQLWKNNETGFQQNAANSLLVDEFKKLSLAETARVFVFLCGKTRDISWLLGQGYCVVGVELSILAVEDLFVDLGVTPSISTVAGLQHFKAPNIDTFAGDIFDLQQRYLGPVDAIYDRAAVVALPAELRGRYAQHVAHISLEALQFVICFEYDQTLMQGPPFSIDRQELIRIYGERYQIEPLALRSVDGRLMGRVPAQEVVWQLK